MFLPTEFAPRPGMWAGFNIDGLTPNRWHTIHSVRMDEVAKGKVIILTFMEPEADRHGRQHIEISIHGPLTSAVIKYDASAVLRKVHRLEVGFGSERLWAIDGQTSG